MDYILSDFLSATITSLENLRKNDVCKEFSCIFKCAELEDYLNQNITESIQFCELFKELMEIKGPVLYWYEIISNHSMMKSSTHCRCTSSNKITEPFLFSLRIQQEHQNFVCGEMQGKVLGACHSTSGLFHNTDNSRPSALPLGKGTSSGGKITCLGI